MKEIKIKIKLYGWSDLKKWFWDQFCFPRRKLVAWGEFAGMLTYKAELNDKKIVKIDRFYPSSKTCHNCGYVKKDLKLSDRKWVCPDCGAILDRDVNAAINILSAGLADYTCGGSVKPAMVGACEARTPLFQ